MLASNSTIGNGEAYSELEIIQTVEKSQVEKLIFVMNLNELEIQ